MDRESFGAQMFMGVLFSFMTPGTNVETRSCKTQNKHHHTCSFLKLCREGPRLASLVVMNRNDISINVAWLRQDVQREW
jgi:hypothetical protein